MSRGEWRKEIYIFFVDAVKCFDKLWLLNYIRELKKLRYNKSDLEVLCKLNETMQVKIKIPYGDTKNIKVREMLKQGTIHGTIMCCALTGKVNEIAKKVICNLYGNKEKGVSVFMD